MATSEDPLEEPWRVTCPRGHSDYEPINGHWWCRTCHRSDGIPSDGSYEVVVDQQTGEEFDREDLHQWEKRQPKHETRV